jgi:hypothetical protein
MNQERRTGQLEIEDFIKDYLSDTDEGLKALVTFFLNLVMQFEANQQAGVEKYQRSSGRVATRAMKEYNKR